MNCIFPYNITIKKIIDTYNNSINNFDKQYLLNKVFKELLYFLQIDLDAQKKEIIQATKYIKNINEWKKNELIVLYGSLLEQEIANTLINWQLSPIFNNTTGNIINMCNNKRMEQFDIIVSSLQNNSLYGFDVKHGTIFRKAYLQYHKLFMYNVAFNINNLSKIYIKYKYQAEQEYKQKINPYVLLVCYDLLSQYNYEHQTEYYRNIFNDEPNHIEKVCFVVNLNILFKSYIDEDGEQIFYFNKKSPYVLSLYDNTYLNYFYNLYAIDITSPACMTLHNFIKKYLIN